VRKSERVAVQRRRVSLRSSANSAVKSDELSARRWDTFRRAFVFPGGSGDFLVPYFLVILRLRLMPALDLWWSPLSVSCKTFGCEDSR
jgi:hypothetical protein